MSTNLEKRVAELEHEMADVKQQIAKPEATKDWRRTVGLSKDDPGFQEMIRLGRDLRDEEG